MFEQWLQHGFEWVLADPRNALIVIMAMGWLITAVVWWRGKLAADIITADEAVKEAVANALATRSKERRSAREAKQAADLRLCAATAEHRKFDWAASHFGLDGQQSNE